MKSILKQEASKPTISQEIQRTTFKIREHMLPQIKFWITWGLIVVLFAAFGLPAQIGEVEAGDWSSYLADNSGSSFNQAETVITAKSAPHLKQYWRYHVDTAISTQPAVSNGMIYWGSWDGEEHATNLKGGQIWAVNIGKTTDESPDCYPHTVGVANTAAIALVSINGQSTSVAYVGGGNDNFYALNAETGEIIWKTQLAPQPYYFIWSSPALYNGSIYIGLSSFGDCPLVQGKLIQLNATTGAIQHTFKVVPDGCIGGGIWGSPVIDQVKGTIYFATGDDGGGKGCSKAKSKAGDYPVSLIELNASNLSLKSAWQVPRSKQIGNGDFGNTPTLFQATIKGVVHHMVGVANKNGMYYAFDRDAINKGPVWSVKIAEAGESPENGEGSISPSAWDGKTLYVAGGKTTIKGASCRGGLRAFDPATGKILWEDCMKDGSVLGAVTAVLGVVAVGEGSHLIVVAAESGKTLFNYTDTNKFSYFYGAPCISHGVLYIGNFDGNLYAFGT